jgi:hypothetical protein
MAGYSASLSGQATAKPNLADGGTRGRRRFSVEFGSPSGGSELANYQLFVDRLCGAHGLERPKMTQEQNHLNDYVFERRVNFKHSDGSRSAGRIDCYRRVCFVLEAKQSGKRQPKTGGGRLDLIPEDEAQTKQGQAKRGTRGWDAAGRRRRRLRRQEYRQAPRPRRPGSRNAGRHGACPHREGGGEDAVLPAAVGSSVR